MYFYFRKFVAAILVVNVFINDTAFLSLSQASVWEERRELIQTRQALPLLPPVRSIVDPELLSSAFVRMKKSKYLETNTSAPVVIHIQDIHRNLEAQKNIAAAIQEMIRHQRISAIALEGAFHEIDLSRFKKFLRPETIRSMADYLLNINDISGPIHAALTHSHPTPPVVGVDDEKNYEANIEAYRRSILLSADIKKNLSRKFNENLKRKLIVFNSKLLELDQKVQAYRRNELKLGDFVSLLLVFTKSHSLPLERFKEAIELERTLDFSAVQKERDVFFVRLLTALDSVENKRFMTMNVAYSRGELSIANFYAHVQKIAERTGANQKMSPVLRDYFRYVGLVGLVDAGEIFDEIESVQARAYTALIKNKEERQLAQENEQLYLIGKLLDFSLTSQEWAKYKIEIDKTLSISQGFNLSSFEDFYRKAEARDVAMASNVLRLIEGQQSTVILVTGGFHSDGINRRLAEAGVTTITYVPKITKVETENGTAYLSAFCQEKAPLDRLFEGDRLFLAGAPFSEVVANGKAPSLATAIEAKNGMNGAAQIFNRLLPTTRQKRSVWTFHFGKQVFVGIGFAVIVVTFTVDRAIGKVRLFFAPLEWLHALAEEIGWKSKGRGWWDSFMQGRVPAIIIAAAISSLVKWHESFSIFVMAFSVFAIAMLSLIVIRAQIAYIKRHASQTRRETIERVIATILFNVGAVFSGDILLTAAIHRLWNATGLSRMTLVGALHYGSIHDLIILVFKSSAYRKKSVLKELKYQLGDSFTRKIKKRVKTFFVNLKGKIKDKINEKKINAYISTSVAKWDWVTPIVLLEVLLKSGLLKKTGKTTTADLELLVEEIQEAFRTQLKEKPLSGLTDVEVKIFGGQSLISTPDLFILAPFFTNEGGTAVFYVHRILLQGLLAIPTESRETYIDTIVNRELKGHQNSFEQQFPSEPMRVHAHPKVFSSEQKLLHFIRALLSPDRMVRQVRYRKQMEHDIKTPIAVCLSKAELIIYILEDFNAPLEIVSIASALNDHFDRMRQAAERAFSIPSHLQNAVKKKHPNFPLVAGRMADGLIQVNEALQNPDISKQIAALYAWYEESIKEGNFPIDDMAKLKESLDMAQVNFRFCQSMAASIEKFIFNGTYRGVPEPVDIVELIHFAKARFLGGFPEITIVPPVEGSSIIIGDYDHLLRVFDNLFRNAQKHGARVNTKVKVTIERVGLECVITVEDDGEGFKSTLLSDDPDEADSLWLSNVSGGDSSGFGLSIAHQIVGEATGQAYVQRVPNQDEKLLKESGKTRGVFIIRFPLDVEPYLSRMDTPESDIQHLLQSAGAGFVWNRGKEDKHHVIENVDRNGPGLNAFLEAWKRIRRRFPIWRGNKNDDKAGWHSVKFHTWSRDKRGARSSPGDLILYMLSLFPNPNFWLISEEVDRLGKELNNSIHDRRDYTVIAALNFLRRVAFHFRKPPGKRYFQPPQLMPPIWHSMPLNQDIESLTEKKVFVVVVDKKLDPTEDISSLKNLFRVTKLAGKTPVLVVLKEENLNKNIQWWFTSPGGIIFDTVPLSTSKSGETTLVMGAIETILKKQGYEDHQIVLVKREGLPVDWSGAPNLQLGQLIALNEQFEAIKTFLNVLRGRLNHMKRVHQSA
ncbi:MAG: ATP-binding protein [Elusimicrobiota bacterium]